MTPDIRRHFQALAIALLPIAPANLIQAPHVNAVVSSDEVSSAGDAADDPAIWIHPKDPSQSLVIATDKGFGLMVFNLEGKILQKIAVGRLNNVDLRYGFAIAGRKISLVAAGNRSTNTIAFFEVDEASSRLKTHTSSLPAGLEIYGSCLYQSPEGTLYVFVNSKKGEVIQWRVYGSADGTLSAQKVRSFHVGSKVEACVADDEARTFYISEEDVGIWKYQADPTGGSERILVDAAFAGGHLVADVEGLAIFKKPSGGGYLIASSQGDNSYVIYDRYASNQFVNKFKIGYSGATDTVRYTDGLEVTNVALSPKFPQGMLVVQDGYNGGSRQNFKFVSWQDVELAIGN